MKCFGFILCFILLFAPVLISYAGRTYPPLQAHNPKAVEAQKGLYHPNNDDNSGWGGWGGWP